MTKVAAFSCCHAPYTDMDTFDRMLGVIEDEQPDIIVNLGDWFDGQAASVHNDFPDHNLEDEYNEAATQSKRIRRLCPKAKLIWTLGNHDANITKLDPKRIPPQLHSLIDWNNSKWFEEFRHWKQFPYINGPQAIYKTGPLHFYHGFSAGINSDMEEALLMSYQLDMKGVSNWGGCFIRGHTHRLVQPTQCRKTMRIPLNLWYANVGTIAFGNDRPAYASRVNTASWASGIALFEHGKDGWDGEVVCL